MLKISRENCVYAMSAANAPAAHIKPGERVLFETHDCFTGQIKQPGDFSGISWDKVNPATGPVFVEGAEVGDVLAVYIEKIHVADKGVVVACTGVGALGHMVAENQAKILPIVDDKVVFSDKISFPINKMIGVIGTAPAEGEIPCGEPGEHGGNMDCKDITEGTTVYLPVNVAGGLVALGDLHAAMGDGEISLTGLEICGEVTVKIDLIKKGQTNLPAPSIMNDTQVMTLASHQTLDIAADRAIVKMAEYMVAEGFTPEEATMLISLAGDVRVCQMVNPLRTLRVVMPKAIFGNL
ncbi:MAG: acetamidase/formamidase family protein [Defluviitaleaceae bacterium]|nr:acetamidase/formamidase family protein [Defluviitaleaceae bacterium]